MSGVIDEDKKGKLTPEVEELSVDNESIKFVDNSNVENRRQIGLTSAIFIIFNRIIGTGYVEHSNVAFSSSDTISLPVFSPLRVRFCA